MDSSGGMKGFGDLQAVLDRPQAEDYRAQEPQLLEGFLEALETQKSDVREWPLVRDGKVLFTIHVMPLDEAEFTAAGKHGTTFDRPKRAFGAKVPIDTDNAKFRSALIHKATTAEDRKRFWDNDEYQRKAKVVNGIDLIDKVLRAGEKSELVDLIQDISGFKDDLEEEVKSPD